MSSKADIVKFAFQTFVNDLQSLSFVQKDLINNKINQNPATVSSRDWYNLRHVVYQDYDAYD